MRGTLSRSREIREIQVESGTSVLSRLCLGLSGCLSMWHTAHNQRGATWSVQVRPPGHHAASEKSLRRREAPLNPEGIGAGFCLVNNVLVGAKYAHDLYGWRVAVIDFDAHHG